MGGKIGRWTARRRTPDTAYEVGPPAGRDDRAADPRRTAELPRDCWTRSGPACSLPPVPTALPLRFLQTARQVAAENDSTTLVPVPVELFGPIRRLPGREEG